MRRNGMRKANVEHLLETLSAGEEDERVGAGQNLGKSRDARVAKTLSVVLRDDVSPRVRKAAALALGSAKDPAAMGVLAHALGAEPNAGVRRAMAASLGKRGD